MAEYKATNVCPLPAVDRLPMDAASLGNDFHRYLTQHLGRFQGCTPYYLYEALSLAVRDRIMADWRDTWIEYKRENEIDPLRLRPHPLEFEMYYDC